MIDEEIQVDESKHWEDILDETVAVYGPFRFAPVKMTMSELIEWLESERGFLRRVFEAAFLAQYQRVQDVVTKTRTQYAKNHYCGGNCSSCGDFSCDVCAECPEVVLCEKSAGVICERDPIEMVKYADALADWFRDRKKGAADE
ncbi:MAG: hypothetical protein J6Y26_03805 [Lachnospiraceae bacterium]|nr:hypothetical protein [Lachnospiraceae bacterium]